MQENAMSLAFQVKHIANYNDILCIEMLHLISQVARIAITFHAMQCSANQPDAILSDAI